MLETELAAGRQRECRQKDSLYLTGVEKMQLKATVMFWHVRDKNFV